MKTANRRRRYMSHKIQNCSKCRYLKCYAIVYQNYYCDHEDRTDDMGKLTEENLKIESPEWCPRYGKVDITDDKN